MKISNFLKIYLHSMNICLKTSTKIGGIMYRRTVVSIYSEGGQESTVQEIENRKVNILRSQFSSIINR